MHSKSLVALAGLATIFLLGGRARAATKIPRKMTGKIYFTPQKVTNASPSVLLQQFKSAKPKIVLTRGKKPIWTVNMVAFFRKAAHPGPITIWIYDKADRASIRAKQPVHAISVNRVVAKAQFVYELEFDPNTGFNGKHTYVVQVGQIIGKRNRIYARGQVDLKR